MIEGFHPKAETSLRACLITAGKVLRVAMIIALMGAWLGLVDDLCYLALDYPLRRAGENAEFPPVDTLPFYIGCAVALFEKNGIFGSVLALLISFISTGPGVPRWRSQFLISLAVVMLPVVLIGGYRVYAGVQWISANPRQVHAGASG